MRFYNATRFVFPRRYELRLLLVCIATVHVPLLACVALQALTGQWQPAMLIAVLAATLAGTAICIAAIHCLLSPIALATTMIEAVQSGKRIQKVPLGGDDLVGRLLISVTKAANESAERLDRLMDVAERDPLTGIRNRRGFIDCAKILLEGRTNSVIALADIDHFKLINDQFGHDEGDAVLIRFAGQVADGIRRTDVVARWGGEEFIILFPGTTVEEARLVLERLRTRIALDPSMGKPDWPVTFSCGIAPVRHYNDLAEATRKADAALYAAKQGGRNRLRTST